MKLATTWTESDGAAPPLLIAPGLFGSGRNWGVIAKRLSDRGPVCAVDMRNHGESPWDQDHSYAALAGDLAETIDGTWDVLGHSMGGKAAMALALTQPDKVRRLVVADIAPVAYGHSQADLVEAMRGMDLDGIGSRKEADARLAERVKDQGTRAFLLQSLDYRAQRWDMNLDVLDREMGTITGWPEDLEGRFEGPALFLSGGESEYVQESHRSVITDFFPHARFARIPGAGHWLHAQKPRETEDSVRVFLDA